MSEVARRTPAAIKAALDELYARRNAEAERIWGPLDDRTRQRSAMLIAAWLMDEAEPNDSKDTLLANWLRWARPEFAREVATGVAVLALRDGRTHVWDVLAALDAIRVIQAGWWFDEPDFSWLPKPEWLIDDQRKGGDSNES